MSVQQFCLRWNNHQPNFISVCSSLLHNGTLVDVTLAAEGRQLQAHKIVLSACSSYFQTLFTSNPCQHPIVILKDVQYNDLKTMVDFMYYGEVNVSQEQLPHILKTAEMLKIKGLAEMPDAAASLTKSESKSSSEQPDQLQPGSGESLWGSTESQFQHHHHQHHAQHHLQPHHQQRRSPSPTSSGASPATRRKRLRKSSNSGSAERTSEEQSSVDGSANINLSQMAQMSFGGTGTNLTQTLHTKIIKESSSTDTDTHPQDSSQESIDDTTSHQHHVQQIKPETDLSNVQQSIPLDISGPATPSEQEGPNAACTQSQSSHSGVQWTVVDSNYPRFSLSSCQASISIGGDQSSDNGANAPNGQHHPQQQQPQQQQQQQTINTSSGNSVVTTNQQGHIQMHYQGSAYNPQMISVNSLVSNYSQNLSTPTSPTESTMVQSVYSQGPTPTQSPVHQIATGNSTTGNANQQNQPTQSTPAPQKRKRSVNPQSDENFIRALEAVRTGGIGFCKAARLYGVNNRTLWLEYKKRGYPISRPSIKNRIKLEPNISPPPSSTPTNEETTIENYEHINQPAINMQVPPTSETPTPIMCPPHAHPMGVMSFLDTRHMEFPTSIHTMPRQRYADSAVNVNTAAMNLQDKIDASAPVGTKRNRFLIRQPRIKRDSDTSQQSPEIIELEHTSSRNLLSVPPKIERHSSEPAPSIAPSSPQLLSVPGQSTPLLVKQHSHPLLPSNHSPPLSLTSGGNFSLHRQLSQPTPTAVISSGDAIFTTTACILSTNTITASPGMVQFIPTIPIKHEPVESSPSKIGIGPNTPIVLMSDQMPPTGGIEHHLNPIRVKTDELQRSASSPQTAREPSLDNPRSSHCPVIRPGPALGCNFCWNTIDAHGRILRRKTKYHCPECQTNLCIVPCFQEYHERQGTDNQSSENMTNLVSSGSKGLPSAGLRHYPKTGSI